MRNVFIGLVCLLTLVLIGCVGMQTKSGYYAEDKAASLMGHQLALVNYGLELGYLSHEEAAIVVKPMKEIMNLPIGFNRNVYLDQYHKTKQGLVKYSWTKEEYREATLPQIAEWAPRYVGIHNVLLRGIAKESQQRQVASMNRITQALEESSEMYQQSTYQMMNNAQNQLPVSKPIVNYNRTNQSGNYLINTDEGIEQVRCMTMSDGSVFCY